MAKTYQAYVDARLRAKNADSSERDYIQPLGGYFPNGQVAADYSSGLYYFRFRKHIRVPGREEMCQTYTVSVGFTTKRNLPWWQNYINPAHIIITSYPEPTPETLAPRPCKEEAS